MQQMNTSDCAQLAERLQDSEKFQGGFVKIFKKPRGLAQTTRERTDKIQRAELREQKRNQA